MELSQLRTFRVVAETLNFTRAAERLNLTQSAVSHQIKALEKELGEPLFIRTKRGVKVSQVGKVALEHAERILDEAEAMREHVSGREHTPIGRVRAAAATQAFVHLFAPLFESFMRKHPRIELSFRTTVSTDQTVTDILDGAADVGFASVPVYSPTLHVTELFEDELILVVGKKHPLANQQEVRVEQLEGERLILFERGASIRRTTVGRRYPSHNNSTVVKVSSQPSVLFMDGTRQCWRRTNPVFRSIGSKRISLKAALQAQGELLASRSTGD